jgi:replicative DNA helicase Mcm
VAAFEDRIEYLEAVRDRIESGGWTDVESVRDDLGLSQQALADGMDVTQTAISYYEQEDVVPDGGRTADAKQVLRDRIERALSVSDDIQRLRSLAENDLRWDQVESIESVDPDVDWVYDLEVADTHSYVSNGVVSHNSQMLQYIQKISPRSVYSSGKGSSAAGLCVTGDTMVHTAEGFVPIREIATEYHPDPVSEETAAEATRELYTYDREAGSVEPAESSHVWRMPEKECRRVETAHGKELEASTDTPLLVCGEDGLEWREITEVEPGDHVAVPQYDGIERHSPPVREFLELTNEKIKPTAESVEFLRTRLREEFGTLRDAAAELGLSEDFVYDSLSNRHLPLEKLERILDAVGADLREIDLDRVMLRHGDGVRIPGEFDAELLYLAGLVFGDGDVMVSRRGGNRGHVRISNSDEELLERAAEIFERKFGKSPAIEYQDDRVPSIRVHSATVARFFSNLGVESPKDDIALDPRLTTAEHADAFLRGLFDADGSVSVRDDGGSSVQYSSTCDELARQVQLMLESYGIRARTRERDRRGTYELESGYEIESTSVQTHLAIYGTEVDRFADAVGFQSEAKSTSLSEIVEDAPRRGERLPVGDALARTDGAGGSFYTNVERGDDPSRSRARELLADRDLGDLEGTVEEVVDADLVWDEVVAAEDTGKKEVFDLTVPETHNFLGNGIVTHNTAAAVRDDFGEGQQWSLEAGALVLADRGIAAIDELDKMECVTGDTLVHHPGGVERIADVARRVAEDGEIEELSNGRRIRDVDLDVWTMADDGSIVRRPVTTVHEYDAPSSLTEVTLSTGESLKSTDDHPYFVFEDGERVERPASDLDAGDWVYVPREVPSAVSDGGTAVDPGEEGTEQSARGDPPTIDGDVKLRTVETVDSVDAAVDRETPKVYDLTVEDTHNFLANGLVVHNSDDRSAMHEALEQQSYHPDTEVLLADGRRVEIGEFVDERMAENEVVDGVDCEILPVDDAAVHSVDVENGETTKLPIDRVSRHEAPEEFVRVTFSNGREVTVTPEHPMFVAEEGIDTVEAREIEAGAFVPAPRKLPNSSAAVDLEGEPTRGTEKDVSLPGELTPDLAEALGFLVAEGHSYAGSSHEIGFSNQDERLLARMEELMTGVFGVESSDNVNAAGTVTKRWTSTKLYRWFEANVPEVMETARDKRIPARVLGASEEVIRRFLVGAFAGDGGVESEAMSYSTASEGLANDYADALSKVGVASRIHHDTAEDSWKVYVMGDSTERFVEAVVDPADDRHERAREFVERSNETPRHHDVLPTEAAREIRELRTLLGLSLTGKFRPTLDEGYGVQVDTVEAEVATLRERIAAVEAELADADSLPEIRAAIDWSCGTLADRLGDETASSIDYAENGGYDPDRRGSLADRARGTVEDALADASRRLDALVDRADLRYYRVREVETVANEGERATEWVYDVTVEPTNTFVSQGVVLHNSISISKAGINATLKSRCSLLGAANPKYGRFDQYEPIGEQIDLEPALISRFDLIFTVTDKPDEEEDRRLADHILTTNYAGELNTQREEMTSPDVSQEEVESFTDEVDPDIDPGLFRKYVAYAKQTCHPRMTEEAREEIKEFYTDLRSKGTDEDAPVPVTARQLEAIVRLAEASARVRLSDRVTLADSKRVIELVRSCLEDVGVDPESGEFDADVVETGTSKSQRERIKNIKGLIADVEEEYDDGAPVDVVLDRADEIGLDRDKAEHEIDKLKQKGEVYEPSTDHLRTT